MKPRASHLRVVGTSPDAQEEWLASVAGHYAAADRDALHRVLDFIRPLYGERRLATGVPAIEHALGVAALLAELRLDQEVLAAALLFQCHGIAPESAARLSQSFGRGVADLADGVVRMGEIGALSSHS